MKKDLVADELISQAKIVFSRFGYRKTTMEDIAAEAGRRKSSLYYYYKSKEDVFRAVIRKEAGCVEESIRAAVNEGEGCLSKLELYIKSRMKGMKDLSVFYIRLKSELHEQLDLINETRKDFDRAEILIVKEIIDFGINRGEIRKLDSETAASNIVLMLKGLELQLFVFNNDGKEDESVKCIADIVINGLTNK